MKKSLHLLVALILMAVGWGSAFWLAGRPMLSQGYWLIPALVIGAGIGLCLRHINGRKTALLLAVTAALGLTLVNLFFPGSRVSLNGLRARLHGTGYASLNVQLDRQFQTPPFDKPLYLTSPVPLKLELFNRLPAGIDDFCFSATGTLYASLPSLGAVYRIEQTRGVSHPEPQLFLAGLDHPSGLICNSEQVVVAESTRIIRYDSAAFALETLVDHLPADGGEVGHRLQMTPQGLLFTIGARCDACKEKDPRRGTVQIVRPSGTVQLYASGLRNLGGLAFTAEDHTLWGGERSRQFPQPGAADELNRLVAGGDYGWPACEGLGPDAEKSSRCRENRNAELLLRHRANPAGLMTAQGLAFPVVYRNSLLMVLQGDHSSRIVPALVRIPLVDGRASGPVAFLGGWDGVTTRPSAIHAGPDGAIYIADDISGAIYRAAWQTGE